MISHWSHWAYDESLVKWSHQISSTTQRPGYHDNIGYLVDNEGPEFPSMVTVGDVSEAWGLPDWSEVNGVFEVTLKEVDDFEAILVAPVFVASAFLRDGFGWFELKRKFIGELLITPNDIWRRLINLV